MSLKPRLSFPGQKAFKIKKLPLDKKEEGNLQQLNNVVEQITSRFGVNTTYVYYLKHDFLRIKNLDIISSCFSHKDSVSMLVLATVIIKAQLGKKSAFKLTHMAAGRSQVLIDRWRETSFYYQMSLSIVQLICQLTFCRVSK